MQNGTLMRGKQFYFQRDLKNGWAWCVTAIAATADKLARPEGCNPDDYGHTFTSADEMATALDKWTGGSFDVTWMQFSPESIKGMSETFGIYQDGTLYQECRNSDDFLAVAEELALTHTAHTWTVRTKGQYLVAVFRRACTDEVTAG